LWGKLPGSGAICRVVAVGCMDLTILISCESFLSRWCAVGVTTVGDVRAAGGTVTPTPTVSNPNHCTMCGITPQKASSAIYTNDSEPEQALAVKRVEQL